MQAVDSSVGTAPDSWLDWLNDSALGAAMRGDLWLYPMVEVVHILGFSVLFGAVLMFDLRVLGLSKSIEVTALARHLHLRPGHHRHPHAHADAVSERGGG